MNIVSSLSIDISENDKLVKYKTFGRKSKIAKRNMYWQLAFVYYSTSVRFNAHRHHILYTNDQDDFPKGRFDFRKELSGLGVEIRYYPFKRFYIPDQLSEFFKNAYYKFEILDQLQHESGPSILTDLDCMWVRPWLNLEKLVQEYDLLLYDVYDRSGYPLDRSTKGVSMKDMGDLFKQIDSRFAVDYPIWYGGEFIGSRPEVFGRISSEIKEIFDRILTEAKKGFFYRLPNGESLLDGDEHISSLVYNLPYWRRYHVNTHFKRLWPRESSFVLKPTDQNLSIWHLPSEKITAFDTVFSKISNHNSSFWSQDPVTLPEYLGRISGVLPQPMHLKILHLAKRIYSKLEDKLFI